jgi:hypothetical protein
MRLDVYNQQWKHDLFGGGDYYRFLLCSENSRHPEYVQELSAVVLRRSSFGGAIVDKHIQTSRYEDWKACR